MSDSLLQTVSAKDLGLSPRRWERALGLAEELCATDQVPALSFQVQREGMTTGVYSYGRRLLNSPAETIDESTLFLVASLTKPMLAMAVMLLVEEGKLGLNQRVVELIEEFNDPPKRPITVRHLLTHTSGLPDMLPNNQRLRAENSPLSRFIEGTCAVTLDFPPGRAVQYQSMGYALLGEIVTRVSGTSYPEFVRQRVCEPLGMNNTWLGLPDDLYGKSPVAEVRVPEEQREGDAWNWNSRYWQTFGAPWGGLVSTVSDLSRFCRIMLNGGTAESGRLFSMRSIELATTNRLYDFDAIPEADRRTRGWGFGWRMNWLDSRGCFGDLLEPEVYGHWGATGTLFWIDALNDTAAVILSTEPIGREQSPLVRLSNAIAAAIE